MAKWDVFKSKTFKTWQGVDAKVILRLIEEGKLGPDDCVRRAGEREWKRIEEMRPLLSAQDKDPGQVMLPGAAPPAAPPAARPPAPPPRTTKPRSARRRQNLEDSALEIEVIRASIPIEERAVASTPSRPIPRRPRDEEDDSFAFPRRDLEVEEFDLTPMVDMTFLLNMFFIMTTSYALLRSIEVPVPAPASGKGAAAAMATEDVRDNSIQVTIGADNTVLVDEDKVPIDQLVGQFRQLLRDTARTEVILKPDPAAFHETVVAVYDSAQAAGMQKIQLVAPAAESGSP